TENRAVQANLVEHARDVDVDGKIRHGLWQEKREQDQPAPAELESGKRVAGGNGDEETHDHSQERDPHAGPERRQGIAAWRKNAFPKSQSEFLRQLAGEIPLLRKRPQEQIGERT